MLFDRIKNFFQKEKDTECIDHPMFANRLMAHSCSGMDGRSYHNTMAALQHGLEEGYRYFETDVSLTTDGRLVLCHGWAQKDSKHTGLIWEESFNDMTYERFMKLKVHGNPVMDVRQLYDWMKKHPDCYFELDFHQIEGEKMQAMIRELLCDFQYPKDEKTIERLLIQVYTRKQFEDIDAIHHFTHYQYLVGKQVHKLDQIISYAKDKGICALAMRTFLAKPKLVQRIRKEGLYILCYTVSHDLAAAQKLLDSGVNTLCTDFITYEMLEENTERMGQHPFSVYYHSGSTEALSNYPKETAGKVKRLKSGNLEYQDPTLWENDGTQRLRKGYFSLEGKHFAGWHMRVQIDGKTLWYCKDHMYHIKSDFEEGTIVVPHLFADEEVLPKWTVEKGCRFVMVAVWK